MSVDLFCFDFHSNRCVVLFHFVVLIYISLVNNDVEHMSFMYLFAICISYFLWLNVYYFALFLLHYFFFIMLSFESLDPGLFARYMIANIFSLKKLFSSFSYLCFFIEHKFFTSIKSSVLLLIFLL